MSEFFSIDEIQEGAGRIVSFELSKDRKTVQVEECCDNYFKADLNKAEVEALIAKLAGMRDLMVDASHDIQRSEE